MRSELARRIAFTLGALLFFRIGTYIPIPGIDPAVWASLFRSQSGGILGAANVSSGGAIARLAIFALGIAPYITAAIAIQLLAFFSRRLRALQSSGERGRRRLRTTTRVVTLVLALLQSYGIATALADIDNLVTMRGALFMVSTTLTFTAGTMLLIWLADQITLRGIGNGIALLLSAGIVLELPKAVFNTIAMNDRGLISSGQVMGYAIVMVVLVFVIALMERARRRERVEFPVGANSGASELSLKLNGAGMIPAIVASWVLSLPLPLAVYFGDKDPARSREIAQMFDPGQPLRVIGFVLLALFCVYLYTAMVFDPDEAAEGLKSRRGVIPGIEPGEATAIHLDALVSRTTLAGAIYFVAICLVPEVLHSRAQVPFLLSGTSLLILVCTVLDVESQARQLARLS